MANFKRKSMQLFILPASLVLGVALISPFRLLAEELPVKPEPQTLPVLQPESVPQPASEPAPEPAPEPVPFDAIDIPRDYLSAKFVNLASNIDRYFGDDRNYQESNSSVFQLDLTKGAGYGSNRKTELSVRVNLRLPNTEDRLHLLLETDPEKNLTTEKTPVQPVIGNKVVAPKSLALAARYVKAEIERWHFSTDVGIQFHGLAAMPNPFTRARASYALPLDQWRLKAAQSVFWFNSIGLGETTQLDLERILSEPVLFRASSNATWLYEKKNFDLRQDLSIYHTLNERTALLYQASAIGVSNPQVQVTDYAFIMVYRYRLHRDWMFFEISPQMHFPKERNFQSSPLLNLRLEMLFDESR